MLDEHPAHVAVAGRFRADKRHRIEVHHLPGSPTCAPSCGSGTPPFERLAALTAEGAPVRSPEGYHYRLARE